MIVAETESGDDLSQVIRAAGRALLGCMCSSCARNRVGTMSVRWAQRMQTATATETATHKTKRGALAAQHVWSA
eukprot:1900067-Rhodomonas_salina.2